jgi:LysR family transcriptional regulator, benzoate and cis,cis-muconate-responsive activator of ben and cat genes
VDPELRHLRSFVAVAEELSFTRAARRMHVTQQSLSATIKQLETNLGGQLLRRTSRAVALTEAGDVLLAHARVVLAAADEAISTTRAAVGRLAGRFTGGLAFDVELIVNPALQRFQERHPGVQLGLSTGLETQLFEALTGGRLDFVINWVAPPTELPLTHTSIATNEAVLLLPAEHAFAARSALALADLADLSDEPLVIFPRWVAPCSFARILQLLGDEPNSPRRIIEVPLLNSGTDAIVRAVADGRGIGLVDSSTVDRHLDGRAVARRFTPPLLTPVELAWRTDAPYRTHALLGALLAARPGADA